MTSGDKKIIPLAPPPLPLVQTSRDNNSDHSEEKNDQNSGMNALVA